VLLKYPFVDPEVKFIRHNENITYKVTEKRTGNAYLLRMHKPITQNMQGIQTKREAIQSELDFLQAWSVYAEWPVQIPFLNREGELVTSTIIECEEIHCSVLQWINGESMSKEDFRNESMVSLLGKRIGNLHQFSRSYRHPSNFIRPEYGTEWINTMLAQLRSGQQIGVISNQQMVVLENVFSMVSQQIQGLSQVTEQWGFIHADIHHSNLIHTSKGISFIDFGLSGFGPYAMDVTMAALFTKKELRENLLSSYSMIVPGEINIGLLEALTFLPIAGHYAFVVSREEKHGWIRERMPGFIEHFCEPFLAGESVF
jgi:Ser/Thr protein kinase RdoA (MazF antagonist)